ncbi:hypothetical protein [Streptomyces sp. NPDC001948]
MTTATPPIPVHILDETTVHIHGEPIAVPPGVNPDQAVMSYLHLESAGVGHPINAQIDDRRYGVQAALIVNPDGTTATAAGPQAAVTTNMKQSGPARQPLTDIHTLAIQGNVEEAIERTNGLLLQLSADPSRGSEHADTLEAAETRAHLAWIKRDYTCAYQTWSWIAATWRELLGPCPGGPTHNHTMCRRIAITTSNAATAWMQLPAQEATEASGEVLALLERNSGSSNTPAAQGIRSRVAKLGAQKP